MACRNRQRTFAGAIIVLLAGLQAAYADSLPPYPPLPAGANNGPTSSWLEDAFGRMLNSCLPGEGKIKISVGLIFPSTQEISSIPRDVVEGFRLTDQAPRFRRFGSAGMTRIFGYVYTRNEQA